jgi:hypothetical protein
LARAGQALPHAPQWATAELSATTQPTRREALQSPKPAAHTNPQAPIAHAARALEAAGHTVPQAPQLVGSELVLVQASPHAVSPAPQVTWQVLAEHT